MPNLHSLRRQLQPVVANSQPYMRADLGRSRALSVAYQHCLDRSQVAACAGDPCGAYGSQDSAKRASRPRHELARHLARFWTQGGGHHTADVRRVNLWHFALISIFVAITKVSPQIAVLYVPPSSIVLAAISYYGVGRRLMTARSSFSAPSKVGMAAAGPVLLLAGFAYCLALRHGFQ